MFRYLSLFSGIEAATVAWHPLGWEPVAFAENDSFPSAVLAHHYPDVPNLGDVTQITAEQIAGLGPIDIVVGGSPCQDLSVAGKRAGLAGARSSLFFHQVRLFKAARRYCGARFLLWENVPGAFSSHKGRDFAKVVEAMAGLRDVDVPQNGWGKEGAAVGYRGLLEWSVLDAQWFGLAQRRKRVFALLDTGDWTGRPPVLLESESLRGDSAPSRETGESLATDVAPCIGASGRGFERAGETRGQDAIVAQPYTVANTLTQRRYKGINTTPDEGQTPVVAFKESQSGVRLSNLHATGPRADVYPTIDANVGRKWGSDQWVNNGFGIVTHCLRAGLTVRRLTPKECSRLQGFPDDYLDVTYRNKPAADGPRYKALGNSMAVPVMRWVGERIEQVLIHALYSNEN